MVVYTAQRRGREYIGDAVARVLREAPPGMKLCAVVPRMLTLFSSTPVKYEVVEADVIMLDMENEQEARWGR